MRSYTILKISRGYYTTQELIPWQKSFSILEIEFCYIYCHISDA